MGDPHRAGIGLGGDRVCRKNGGEQAQRTATHRTFPLIDIERAMGMLERRLVRLTHPRNLLPVLPNQCDAGAGRLGLFSDKR